MSAVAAPICHARFFRCSGDSPSFDEYRRRDANGRRILGDYGPDIRTAQCDHSEFSRLDARCIRFLSGRLHPEGHRAGVWHRHKDRELRASADIGDTTFGRLHLRPDRRPKMKAPKGRVANVSRSAKLTVFMSVPNSCAMSFRMKTTRKKSNASSVQPRKLAMITLRCSDVRSVISENPPAIRIPPSIFIE